MDKEVALFITCLNDQFYPTVGIAVTKILEHFGCVVHFPAEQTCCGQPFLNDGYEESARELAKRMVGIFEPYEYVVTPSASCCVMVRKHFPKLLEGDHAYEHGLRKLCRGTYEFVEFLEKVLKVDFFQFKLPRVTKVTYHHNCHLRGLGAKDDTLRLIQEMRNVEYRPMEQAEQCCGFGGTFAVKYPAISSAIVEDKAYHIAAAGADVTISNDVGCSLNIAGSCHRRNVPTRVCHIAELIAESMGLDVTEL